MGPQHGCISGHDVHFTPPAPHLLPDPRHALPQTQRSTSPSMQVVLNVAEHNNKSIPGFLMSLVLYFVESKVQQLVGVDIFETDFMMHLNLLDLPILFLYSTQDVVVR